MFTFIRNLFRRNKPPVTPPQVAPPPPTPIKYEVIDDTGNVLRVGPLTPKMWDDLRNYRVKNTILVFRMFKHRVVVKTDALGAATITVKDVTRKMKQYGPLPGR